MTGGDGGAELVGWLELFFDLVVVVCTAVRALGSVAIAVAAAAIGGGMDARWFVVLLLVADGWTCLPDRLPRPARPATTV